MEKQTPVGDLQIGMFVTDLDRPWTDTPFLLQGFLIEDDEQLAQLREHCKSVTVDYGRSIGFESMSRNKLAPKASAVTDRVMPTVVVNYVNRPTVKRRPLITSEQIAKEYLASHAEAEPEGVISRSLTNLFARGTSSTPKTSGPTRKSTTAQDAEQRDDQPTAPDLPSVGGIIDRVKGMLSGSQEKKLATSVNYEPADPPRPPVVDRELEMLRVNVYVDKTTVEEELAPAKAAYAKTTGALKNVLDRIKLGQKFEVNEIEGAVVEMVESILRNPDALMWVVRMRERDDAAYAQALRTSVALVTFGRHLGFPQERMMHLAKAGLFLDLGKLKLTESVLKKPARLTPDEFLEVKRHVQYSLDMISGSADLHRDVLEAIEQHHERQDGSGYPKQLTGDRISVIGRMAGIVDTFTALTSARPHVDMISAYDAMRQLSSWRGQFFHEALVEQFIQSIGAFPAGSMVELSSGEVAVVVSHNKTRRLRPKVLVLLDSNKQPLPRPMNVDLLSYFRDGNSIYIRRGLPSGAFGLDERDLYVA